MSKKNKRVYREEDFEDDVIYKPEVKSPLKGSKERLDPNWDPQNFPLKLDNPAAPVPGLQPSRSYRKAEEKKDAKKEQPPAKDNENADG